MDVRTYWQELSKDEEGLPEELKRATNSLLYRFIEYDENQRDEAWKILLENNPRRVDLHWVALYGGHLRDEAVKLILESTPDNYDFCFIMHYVESLRDDMWKRLLANNPTNKEFCYIIKYVEVYRDEAWKLLLANNPSVDDLFCIIQCNELRVEPLQDEAKALLKIDTEKLMNLLDAQ